METATTFSSFTLQNSMTILATLLRIYHFCFIYPVSYKHNDKPYARVKKCLLASIEKKDSVVKW